MAQSSPASSTQATGNNLVFQDSIEVNAPVREVYRRWTDFQSFPQFMSNVEQVTPLRNNRYHWVARTFGIKQEWDAVVTEMEPDRQIAWRSTSGPYNAGTVTFDPLGPNKTEVRVRLEYAPPAGKVGQTLLDLTNITKREVHEDLENFKQQIQGGTTGSGSGMGGTLTSAANQATQTAQQAMQQAQQLQQEYAPGIGGVLQPLGIPVAAAAIGGTAAYFISRKARRASPKMTVLRSALLSAAVGSLTESIWLYSRGKRQDATFVGQLTLSLTNLAVLLDVFTLEPPSSEMRYRAMRFRRTSPPPPGIGLKIGRTASPIPASSTELARELGLATTSASLALLGARVIVPLVHKVLLKISIHRRSSQDAEQTGREVRVATATLTPLRVRPFRMRADQRAYRLDLGGTRFGFFYADSKSCTLGWPGRVDFSQLQHEATGALLPSVPSLGMSASSLASTGEQVAIRVYIALENSVEIQFNLADPIGVERYRQVLEHPDLISFARFDVYQGDAAGPKPFIFTTENPQWLDTTKESELTITLPRGSTWSTTVVEWLVSHHVYSDKIRGILDASRVVTTLDRLSKVG